MLARGDADVVLEERRASRGGEAAGQTAEVMVAPRPVLEALARDGVLELGPTDEAMMNGKAFDQRVRGQ